MKICDELVEMVRLANPDRHIDNIMRRLLKVLEELGETSEACLSVSSPHNYKNKSWTDYREESCDTLIVLIDIALTPMTNFPAAYLIPPALATATEHHVESLEMLYHEKFKIAGAVASAASHYSNNEMMGMLGALVRGIDAASNMCFARIPEDDNREIIEQRVLAIFEKKLDKWNASMKKYAATDNGFEVVR